MGTIPKSLCQEDSILLENNTSELLGTWECGNEQPTFDLRELLALWVLRGSRARQ